MIIVDTNVISDAIAPRPTERVLAWLAAQPVDALWTTAITAAELRAGVALPEGRRKRALGEAVEGALYADFAGRILPFDDAASIAFASISARRRRSGRPVAEMDVQIAAIALVRGATDFDDTGIAFVDPWTF